MERWISPWSFTLRNSKSHYWHKLSAILSVKLYIANLLEFCISNTAVCFLDYLFNQWCGSFTELTGRVDVFLALLALQFALPLRCKSLFAFFFFLTNNSKSNKQRSLSYLLARLRGDGTNLGTNETMLLENCIWITRTPCETDKHENVNLNKCCRDGAAEVIDQMNGRTQPWWWCYP